MVFRIYIYFTHIHRQRSKHIWMNIISKQREFSLNFLSFLTQWTCRKYRLKLLNGWAKCTNEFVINKDFHILNNFHFSTQTISRRQITAFARMLRNKNILLQIFILEIGTQKPKCTQADTPEKHVTYFVAQATQ